MDDLVKRLEALADCDASNGEPLGKCMTEAAATIARQQVMLDRALEDGGTKMVELAAAREEVARLRGLLDAELAYWRAKADDDMTLFNTFDAVGDYPRLRVLTEPMKKADALAAALEAKHG